MNTQKFSAFVHSLHLSVASMIYQNMRTRTINLPIAVGIRGETDKSGTSLPNKRSHVCFFAWLNSNSNQYKPKGHKSQCCRQKCTRVRCTQVQT